MKTATFLEKLSEIVHQHIDQTKSMSFYTDQLVVQYLQEDYEMGEEAYDKMDISQDERERTRFNLWYYFNVMNPHFYANISNDLTAGLISGKLAVDLIEQSRAIIVHDENETLLLPLVLHDNGRYAIPIPAEGEEDVHIEWTDEDAIEINNNQLVFRHGDGYLNVSLLSTTKIKG